MLLRSKEGSEGGGSCRRRSTRLPAVTMAAATQNPATGDMTCPDPSAHEHQSKLSSAASAAALLAAAPERSASQKESPLGSDGKLSSRSESHVTAAWHKRGVLII